MRKGMGISEEEWTILRIFGPKHFPFDKLVTWFETEFAIGFDPDFVPALTRNQKGFVAWLFGDGAEPYWPGKD